MLVEKAATLSQIIEKIKERVGGKEPFDLEIPAGSVLLKNLLNLKILFKEAKSAGVELRLQSNDPRGQNLLAVFSEPREPEMGFVEGADLFRGAVETKTQFLRSPWTKRALLLLIAVSLVVVGLFGALFIIPRATVTLSVGSESLVQSFELLASPSAVTIDKEKKVLPAVLLEVEESGEKKTEATGKKEKGEKAKGEVTIYNWTDEETTFAKETIVTLIRIEGGKLRFLTDGELTVPAQTASVSATPQERTITNTPGKETVAVTAEEVGEKYNVAGGEEFSLQGLSTDEFLAQNKDAFSGGKKEEVIAVTSKDQAKLLEDLTGELLQKARADLESRTVGDQKLLTEALITKVLNQIFDKDVDEEAKEVKLNLTVKASAIVYSKDQLQNLIGELLSESIPEGFNLSDKDLASEVAAAKVIEDEESKLSLQLLVKIKAFVISKLDKEKIKKDLAARSIRSAQNYLEKLPHVSAVEITTFPPLPGPFYRMPRLPDRIDIKLEHE